MATTFELLVIGDDPGHLESVAQAALDEVDRIDRLLSRHNPASEVSRINRDAAARPVRVDHELFAILERCQFWSEKTDRCFDLCASHLPGSSRFDQAVELDPETRLIRFVDPSARLDFGGVGKGIAIDSARRILDEFGVTSALLHGGTSSILACGCQADDTSWRVGIRDPFDRHGKSDLIQLELRDCCLSTSAVFPAESIRSDLIDPTQSRSLTDQASCSVLSCSGFEAEVLSTALLVMGKDRARTFLDSSRDDRAIWIDQSGAQPNVEKLGFWGLP